MTVRSPEPVNPDQDHEFPRQINRNGSGRNTYQGSTIPRKRSAEDRTSSTEYDSDDELLQYYTNHDAPPLTIPAEKRPRFLDTNRPADAFRQTVEDIWHVINRKLLRHQYGPLSDGHIRILIIHPGKYDDPLRVTLMSRSLDSNPRYDALSYVWGDDIPRHRIKIVDKTRRRDGACFKDLPPRERLRKALIAGICGTDGLTFHIRNNLDAALRRIRDKRNRIPLWVDAICMNQKDSDEKSNQLLRMAEIYSKAQKVRVWLGEANQISNLGMDFITEMVQDQMHSHLLEVRDEKKKVTAFLDLIRSKWFSRRWIIQEIFFARDRVLHFGEKSHNYTNFLIALDRVMKRLLNPDTRIKEITGVRADAMETIEAYGANALHRLYSELLDKFRPRRDLDYLIIRLGAFDAGDPRDIIYGVLSLALKRDGFPIPDYKASVLDVFAGFIEYTYNITNQLNILCKHWAPVHTWHFVNLNAHERRRVDTVLPTWMSQLDKASFGTPDDVFLGRKEALPLVEDTYFDASRGAREIVLRFGKRDPVKVIEEEPCDITKSLLPPRTLLTETYDGTLVVKGLILGRIRERSDRMLPEIITRDVLVMGGWKDSGSDKDHRVEDVPKQLWRTLIAHNDGTHADIGDQKACLNMLKKEDRHGDIRIGDLLRDPAISCDTDLKKYLTRARVVCWNRRAFLADMENCENEAFGLCPDQTQVGDLVCIMYGCSVPVILRESTDVPQLGFKLRPGLSRTSVQPSRKNTRRRTKSKAKSNPFHQYGRPATRASERMHTPGSYTRSPSAEPPLDADRWSTSPGYRAVSEGPSRQPNGPFKYYKVIGECYIDRFMDGQAIGNWTTEQEFTLV